MASDCVEIGFRLFSTHSLAVLSQALIRFATAIVIMVEASLKIWKRPR